MSSSVSAEGSGRASPWRAYALDAAGAFALAALGVALWDLPWGKLPSDVGGLAGSLGLALVVACAFLPVALGGAAVATLLRRLWPLLLLLALLSLGAGYQGVELVADALAERETGLSFEELYADFHAVAEAPLYVLGFGALLALLPWPALRRRVGRVGRVSAALCLGAAALLLVGYGALLPIMPRAVIDSDRLTSFTHKAIVYLFDGDGDGSPRLAGIDCDDEDPTVHLMRSEVPGNGRDDNCLLGDARADVAEPAPPPYPRAPLAAPVKRVLVFSWDAVRADHLPLYGYGRDTAPNTTRFAAGAVAFRHVSSPAGMTRNFFAGLTSGRYQVPPPSSPRSLFRRTERKEFERIDTPDVSLFQALGDAGVDRVGCLMHREGWVGFAPGYSDLRCPGCDDLKVRNSRITSPIMLECATDVAEKLDPAKPTLIILHLYDPHGRYRRHKGVPKKWGRKQKGRYDGEIWYADQFFQKALDVFRDKGLLEDAAVIVTADHGEGFLEHGRSAHGYSAYDEMNRVPLIVRMPDAPTEGPVRWVGQPVENGDLGVTLLDLFGVPEQNTAQLGLTGASWLPYVLNPDAPAVRKQAMGYAIRTPESSFSLIEWPHKVVWDRRLNLWELFDLQQDPREQNDLARTRPEVTRALRAALEQRVERHRL